MSGQQTKTQTRKPKADKASGDATVAQDPLLQTAQTQSQAVSDADKAKAEAEAKAKLEAETLAKEQAEQAAKQAAEQQAKDEAEAKAKADEQAKLNPTQQESSNANQVSQSNDVNDESSIDAVGILGALTVRAKSDAGFWRSGVQFNRLKEKLVLVVEHEPNAITGLHAKNHEPECVVFLTAEKAMRIHNEPNLISEYVELDTVLDLDDMQQ
ncbi:MAG: hypothetical protein KJ856_05745 [Gammaproteobacteria bacterium]|uniref:Uncharacterized protein n=1 Tax=viral metagenome TaxID=1070528 RepID=A0A6H1ZQ59_9ZZZZ|nr:hypothetical protein [Gammaproteobacteria bacterium]MBU1477442.1 hypothetical protein [Gammaproteobacteria bacterium]MBU2002605.1 hypothetical protein [Gammaproteobacteria bacterium]MBU2131780.1 hypothetical protein [Gammaproteobacteria bacterium]MBU2186515.1 hypothetical protein [Gammaproteobacteria bacterium]